MNIGVERVTRIRQILEQALSPSAIDVTDESHLHAGHAGAATGKGHFSITVVADKFADHSPIERHRMVYGALTEMMESDIHALRIKAITPQER